MKEFLSIKYFKELKILFILEAIIAVLASAIILVNNITLNYFNPTALGITLGAWCFCCVIEKERYFNLASFIATSLPSYFIFWFMLEIMMTK